MITITYSEKGKAISDFVIDDVVKEIAEHAARYHWTYATSNELLCQAVCTAVAEGKISPEHIMLVFGGVEYAINEYGVVVYKDDPNKQAPYPSPSVDYCERRLQAALAKRKSKRGT